ncbi:PLC-like phosphodiesterase [Xylariomycetidae sp. FL0641]|nr:PLC-like phosphodiesterase [Xylariomycetidae sp. FL0641]
MAGEEQSPLLMEDASDSKAEPGARMPQAIAHRGLTSPRTPENSLGAFAAAVGGGAHALETDLHLSADGVVVLAHDRTLMRLFGDPRRVGELSWAELSRLPFKAPGEGRMIRLLDLLNWLEGDDERRRIWVMLDVKRDDDPEEIMRRTAETIASVPSKRPWSERLTPCLWDANYIRLSTKHLPGFRVTHLGVSTVYARALADSVPGISFSLLRHTLASPMGCRFLRDMRRRSIPVHTWTVNEVPQMRWAIRRRLNGVITDDVVLFRQVCDQVRRGEKRTGGGELEMAWFWVQVAVVQFLLIIALVLSTLRFGSDKRRVRKALEQPA